MSFQFQVNVYDVDMNDYVGQTLPIMLDKMILNGKACGRIYTSIQQTSENVIRRIQVKTGKYSEW